MPIPAKKLFLSLALSSAVAITAPALVAVAASGPEATPLAGQPVVLVAQADAAPAAPADAAPADATPATPAPAAAAPADKPVSYTEEQADRGKKKYESDCVDCHGDDLKGGLNGGAPLRGSAFDQQFGNGAPASGLFGFMSTAMPPNSPGRFSADTYADLMAYVLQKNGYQPGAELPSDLDALDHLIMEK